MQSSQGHSFQNETDVSLRLSSAIFESHDLWLVTQVCLSLSLLIYKAGLYQLPPHRILVRTDGGNAYKALSLVPLCYRTSSLNRIMPSINQAINHVPTVTFNSKPSGHLFLLALYLLSVKFVLFKHGYFPSTFLQSLASHPPTQAAEKYLCQFLCQ